MRMPSSKELADVSLVRSEIDALAARLATELVTDDVVADLQALIDEMLDRLEEQDFPGVTQADVRPPRLLGMSWTMSACRAATERTFLPPPPIMIGGRGRWTGVGVPWTSCTV